MSLTKKNGSVIKPNSKKHRLDFKTNKPNFSLYSKEKLYISFKENNSFVKQAISSLYSTPIPKYKSKKYLIKNTIVVTQNKKKIRITNLNFGRILGQIQQ